MSTPPTKAELYAFAMVADEIAAFMRRLDTPDDAEAIAAIRGIIDTLAAVHLDIDVFADRVLAALDDLLRRRGTP
jgi:hypothetical protein